MPAGGTVALALEVACTYTDPAAAPIPVVRALTCPDGTQVWVRGVVKTKDDGTRWICDKDASASATECADKGLQVIGNSGSTDIQLTGVKSGRTLVQSGPGTPQTAGIPIPAPPSTN
ncbi:MAG: hypothetical protein QOE09_3586 [Ilumatobacteraceae bacterium]